MISIYEIQKYLESWLNDDGTSDNLFKVYYWSQNYDRNYLENGDKFFVLGQLEPISFDENKVYTLSRIVDYSASYEPIPNKRISTQSFALDFYFPSKKTNFLKRYLTEFALELSGKVANLENDYSRKSKVIFKTEAPVFIDASTQHITELSGLDNRFDMEKTEEYTVAEIRFYLTVLDDDVFIANDIKYEIKKDNELLDYIVPLEQTVGNTLETDSEQELNAITTGSTPQTNESTFSFSFYLEATSKLARILINRIYYGTDQDLVVSMLPIIGGVDGLASIKCIITEVTMSGELGAPLMFNIVLKRSDE